MKKQFNDNFTGGKLTRCTHDAGRPESQGAGTCQQATSCTVVGGAPSQYFPERELRISMRDYEYPASPRGLARQYRAVDGSRAGLRGNELTLLSIQHVQPSTHDRECHGESIDGKREIG